MNPLVAQLIIFILGELGQFIIAFVEDLLKGEKFVPALFDAAHEVVSSIDTSTILSGEEKKIAASNAIAERADEMGIPQLSDSQMNTLVELAVQKLKQGKAGS